MPFHKKHFGEAFVRQLLALSVSLAFALSVRGAEAPGKIASKLKLIPACPALVTAVNRDHIPIEGMDVWSGMNTLRPGDSATVLVTFVQKKKQTQWLLYLEAATPDPAKATNKPSTFEGQLGFWPADEIQVKSLSGEAPHVRPFRRSKPGQTAKIERNGCANFRE